MLKPLITYASSTLKRFLSLYKHAWILVLGLLPLSTASAQTVPVYLEGNIGFFYPTDSLFRQIYSVGAIYGIELDVQPYKGITVWTSVNVFPASGYSVGRGKSTDIIMVPIGTGLKYLIPFHRKFRPYIGAGVVPTYFYIHNHNAPRVSQTNEGWGCGGIVKSGFLAYLGRRCFLDVFLNYNYIKTSLQNSPSPPVTTYPIQASNVTFGAGLSYHF